MEKESGVQRPPRAPPFSSPRARQPSESRGSSGFSAKLRAEKGLPTPPHTHRQAALLAV